MSKLLRFFTREPFLLFFILLLLASPLRGQELTNQGKDFWIVYAGQSENTSGKLEIALTANANTTATITLGGVPVAGSPFALKAKETTVVEVLPAAGQVFSSETVEKKGVRVTAGEPLSVSARISVGNKFRSSATVVLPVAALGQDYFALSYSQPTTGLPSGENVASEFSIVATEDNTVVQITPKAATKGGKPADTPFQVTLQAGEVYQVQAAMDLTGSRITTAVPGNSTCKKIAVFSGSTYVRFGCASPSGSENLYQQVYPVNTWGKNYIIVPFANHQGGDILRVLVSEDNTTVRVDGEVFPVPFKGTFIEIPATTARTVTADKPVAVAQYQTAQNCDTRNTNQNSPAYPADMDMLVLSPVEQGVTTAASGGYAERVGISATAVKRYLNVVMKAADAATFTINGQKPEKAFSPLPGSPYAWLQEDVTAKHGAYTALNLAATSAFNAVAYTYGVQESFAQVAGTALQDLTRYINPATSSAGPGCPNTPVHFGFTLPYTPLKLVWDFGDGQTREQTDLAKRVSPDHQYLTAGTYKVKLTVTKPAGFGCGTTDELTYTYLVQPKPTAAFSFANTCSGSDTEFKDAATSPAGMTISQWAWNFGDPASGAANTATTQHPRHRFSAPGTYPVTLTVTGSNGCTDVLTKTVTISPVPVVKFKADPVCQGNATIFTDQTTLNGGSIQSWTWDFGNGATSTEQHPRYTYVSAGKFRVTLKVVTDKSCETIYSQEVVVHPKPQAAFNAADACLGSAVSFTDMSSGTIVRYAWDFGDGNTASTASPTHTFARAGIYTVRLTVTSDQGCEDFLSKTIHINARPEANAGADQLNHCGVTSTVLDAQVPAAGTGAWTVVSGTGGSFANAADPKTTFSGKAGEMYTLRWTVKNAPCPEATDEVQVRFNSVPEVSAGKNTEIIRRESITLQGSGPGTYTYTWSPAMSLNNPAIANPVATPEQTTTYELTVTSPEGCVAKATVTIKVLEKLKVPNAFSPNNDGVNDAWVIEGLEGYRRVTVEVFDRWGNKVYAGGPDGTWDGTYRGKPLAMGTYYYIINQNNGEKALTGPVSIIK